MSNFLVPILTAFVTAIITWFGTNYYGRNLLRFWDLRLEAHKALFISNKSQVRNLAIEIDALRIILPKPISSYLRIRGYDLHGAAQALKALSKLLDGDNVAETAHIRVKAQEALRLPIDPSELAQAYRRIENETF
jgi:hypothetical protein